MLRFFFSLFEGVFCVWLVASTPQWCGLNENVSSEIVNEKFASLNKFKVNKNVDKRVSKLIDNARMFKSKLKV